MAAVGGGGGGGGPNTDPTRGVVGGDGRGGGDRGGGPLETRQLEGVPKYEDEVELCKQFLLEFRLPSADDDSLMDEEDEEAGGGGGAGGGVRKYRVMLQQIADRERTSLLVELDDVLSFPLGGEDGGVGGGDLVDQMMGVAISTAADAFVQRAVGNAQRYQQLFAEAVSQIMAEGTVTPQVDLEEVEDIFDVLERQRRDRIEMGNLPTGEDGEPIAPPELPAALTRRFEVRLLPPTNTKAGSLREVRALDVGRLVRVKGMITRASDVKPLLTVVTYTCDHCGAEIYQEIGRSTAFTPVPMCPTCKRDGRVQMQTRGSRFVRYQELRVQELPDQVPMGHIPRSMIVHCAGATTRQCAPGDIVTIAGIFLPTRYTGYKALKAGLIADTYLEAMDVMKHKKTYKEIDVDEEMDERLAAAAQEADVYDRLARSIAPEIYGHLDVKKALLLQLVGAPFRRLPDGMRIRGDINVILMGDPGVAKSQLIKYIARVAPRGVYTTGKGSSGVGLTAAVMKDPVTGDMSLEGGALVMADMGICCIDEFDKMDEGDRTAIHEVMEQQTVSIAKAGITTQLNARCSVLAAANPLYGRYNKNRTMSENINLPNSLLSRFDLVFLILDRANAERDMALARHVSYVHRNLKNPDDGAQAATYDATFLKHYVAAAREFDPHIPPELTAYIVNEYVALRSEKGEEQGGRRSQRSANVSDQTAMTARQLLSILRLSQALARLRFDDAVNVSDVEEAIRLTRMSKASLLEDEEGEGEERRDEMSRVYTLVLDYMQQHRLTRLEYTRAEAMVVQKGWRTEQLRAMLDFYVEAGVYRVSGDRTVIELVNSE